MLDSFLTSESSLQSCPPHDTPIRQISNHCFRLICSFLFPLLFLFFALPCLLWEHSNLHPFLFAPPTSPHHPPSVLRAGGRSTITHHLVITGTKRALVACLHPLNVHRHWGKTRGKSPADPNSIQSSSPPPQTMKTLSVRIRMERRALTRGITVIKAMPLHLCMSIRLSTSNISLYTNFGIPSLLCRPYVTKTAVKLDLARLSVSPVNIMIKVCMRALLFSNITQVLCSYSTLNGEDSLRKVKPNPGWEGWQT